MSIEDYGQVSMSRPSQPDSMQHNPFFKHGSNMLTFMALYTCLIMQGVSDPVMGNPQIAFL